MALTNAYIQNTAQLPTAFGKLAEGQAPSKFTIQHLKDLGLRSTNFRALIPLLKALGFLTPEGAPTQRYHDYRDSSRSRAVLGEAVEQAYGDLFLIKASPTEKDRALIEGKFKSAHNTSDINAKRMASTFFQLLALADRPNGSAPKTPLALDRADSTTALEKETKLPDAPFVPAVPGSRAPTQLFYNIQIHLPATKEIEVFTSIFKALKEHLLD